MEINEDNISAILEDKVEEETSLPEEEEEEIQAKPIKIKCLQCLQRILIENPPVWWKGKRTCTNCGEHYCCLPDTERQLFAWQDLYFETDDNSYLHLMYECFDKYASSIILKYYQSYIQKNSIYLEEASHLVATDLLTEIFSRKKRVTTSFGAMLIFKIKSTLFGSFYNHRTKAMEVSINIVDDDNKEFFELKSDDSQQVNFEQKENSMFLRDRILKMIFQAEDYCDPGENLMRLLALNRFLQKGESSSDKLFNLYNRLGKTKFEQTLKLIKNEIYKNIDK